MIEAVTPTETIRRAYDFASAFYGAIYAPIERKPRLRGVTLANIQATDCVLEVAFGTGATLVELLQRVSRTNIVYGVELSPKMLAKAQQVVKAVGYTNINLQVADTHHLPFPDGMFDVLYNSYMFDLLPLADIPIVLAEFRRVLKPTGRLVLVNMSKQDDTGINAYERLYSRLPPRLVSYLLLGCRPVLLQNLVVAAGFQHVAREYMRHTMPSEIIVAHK